jgi:hypothetical protein
MATYTEEAKIYVDLIRDKNKLKSQIANPTDVVQIGKRDVEYVEIEAYFKIRQRSVVDDTAIWDNPANTWDDGTHFYGESIDTAWTTICQRRWTWFTQTDLELGSHDNIDVSLGDIRIGD